LASGNCCSVCLTDDCCSATTQIWCHLGHLGHLGHLLLLLLLYSFNSPLITYATNLRYGCVCIHTFVHWGLRGHLHLIGFDQISGCSLDSRSTQHEQEYQDQLPKSICCVISVCSTSIPGCPADEWTTSRTSKQVAS